jgi:DNA-binding MarR family transcriptional regulator
MIPERAIAPKIIGLANVIRRCALDEPKPENSERPTGMQHWILGHIHQNAECDIFQKDLEATFELRRSTATGILNLLEKNGYIKREPVDYDARLKKLSLTPKALLFCEQSIEKMKEMENKLAKGLTQEEITTLIGLLGKIKNNLE